MQEIPGGTFYRDRDLTHDPDGRAGAGLFLDKIEMDEYPLSWQSQPAPGPADSSR